MYLSEKLKKYKAIKFINAATESRFISDAECGMLGVRKTIKLLKHQIFELETRLER